MSARSWCFTLNNPSRSGFYDDCELLDFELFESVRYAIYQLEIGESGTPHFQGYLELDRAQRLSYVKNIVPGAHFESRRGTREQARDYCRKEEGRLDGPWEYGDWNAGGQGTRADIASFKAAVDGGATDRELWDTHPMQLLRYARTLPFLREITQPKRTWKTEVTVVYGEPGLGKTHWIREQVGEEAFWKSPNTNWWDGYSGQADVVMDDYKSWLPWSELMQVLDKYPCRVQVKGGHAQFLAKRIFISTNFTPSEWYGKDEDSDRVRKYPLDALTRRVDKWVLFLRGTEHTSENRDVITRIYTSYDDCRLYL